MKKPIYLKNTIGSDEVGVSNYLGPIIVTSCYMNFSNISFLENLDIKDSKKLSDECILIIAPIIMGKIPYYSYILSNEKYNKQYKKYKNMNIIKSLLHNHVLYKLSIEYNYDYIVIDKFISKENYYRYLKCFKHKVTNITFVTKAEDKCPSVTCASIISRYLFLLYMKNIPKGCDNKVNNYSILLVKKYGFKILNKKAKLNFKNTKKIKRYFSYKE